MAKAIAYNIAKYGTKLYQKGGRKDIISSAINEQKLTPLTQNLQFRFATLIQEEIVKAFK